MNVSEEVSFLVINWLGWRAIEYKATVIYKNIWLFELLLDWVVSIISLQYTYIFGDVALIDI